LLAAYAYLIGGDHAAGDPDVPIREQERVSAGIRVGRDAWIGAGVRVLDGVTIGDGALIGANAVVREPVPDRAVAAGVPARIISTRDRAAT
jgi:acetyltransferase-like isoleucine patch superfamily enzyme